MNDIPFEQVAEKENRQLKIYIGEYVSHRVVRDETATPEYLNSLDRYDLAWEWYEYQIGNNRWQLKRFGPSIDLYPDLSGFMRDVAVYIDMCIPKAYLKYHSEGPQRSPSKHIIKLDEDGNLPFGLLYQFPENYIYTHELPPFTASLPATQKQLDYLLFLACQKNHYFFPENLSLKDASECITYFLNMDYTVVPDCFDKHFRKAF